MPPRVLSVAGSDPSGGAGIQADLKTFHALGAYGMAALTSLTAQNTTGVRSVHEVPAEFVAAQIECVLEDVDVDAAKTGMLKSAAVVRAVASSLGKRLRGRIVVDPVMVATSGDRLLDEDAVEAVVRDLLPLAAVVTPNRAEAEVLAGGAVEDLAGARAAAAAIRDLGTPAVVVKGIPDGAEMVDLLAAGDGERTYRRPVLAQGPRHGSGCTFSAALAVFLARGAALERAVEGAKGFTWRAMRDAYAVGAGARPLNHHADPGPGTP